MSQNSKREAGHTPGPWLRANDLIYSLMHHGWRKGVEQFRNRFWFCVYFDREVPDEEREATINLVQAAPDLLAVLKLAEEHLEEMRRDEKWHPIGHCPVLETMRAVLAKAESR